MYIYICVCIHNYIHVYNLYIQVCMHFCVCILRRHDHRPWLFARLQHRLGHGEIFAPCRPCRRCLMGAMNHWNPWDGVYKRVPRNHHVNGKKEKTLQNLPIEIWVLFRWFCFYRGLWKSRITPNRTGLQHMIPLYQPLPLVSPLLGWYGIEFHPTVHSWHGISISTDHTWSIWLWGFTSYISIE